MFIIKKIRQRKAFTIIEALVFLFIFSVTVVAFYSTFIFGVKSILEVKIRLAAIELANEKMEIIRSLEYETVGTQGSVDVPGNIPQSESISRSGRSFNVDTQIGYVDDEFDGLIIDGSDIRPNDYKKVRVSVSWEVGNPKKEVVMVATFASPGIEPPITGGILSINVLDRDGNGIPSANIGIVNNTVLPIINDNKTTGADGNYLSIGSPASDQEYNLSISKPGYYPVLTYAPYSGLPDSFTPVNVHASVIEGALSSKTIITDLVSQIEINSVDTFGGSLSDVEFDLKGGYKIGEDIFGEAVYDFEEVLVDTGSSGEKGYADRSFGTYFFNYLDNLSDYEFVSMNPSLDSVNNFYVLPGETKNVDAVFADKRINSLLVTVKSEVDGNPVEGATVQLKNDVLIFDISLTTDKNGHVYFPTSMPELTAAQYELKVTAPSFVDSDTNIDIIDFIQEEIILIAI